MRLMLHIGLFTFYCQFSTQPVKWSRSSWKAFSGLHKQQYKDTTKFMLYMNVYSVSAAFKKPPYALKKHFLYGLLFGNMHGYLYNKYLRSVQYSQWMSSHTLHVQYVRPIKMYMIAFFIQGVNLTKSILIKPNLISPDPLRAWHQFVGSLDVFYFYCIQNLPKNTTIYWQVYFILWMWNF